MRRRPNNQRGRLAQTALIAVVTLGALFASTSTALAEDDQTRTYALIVANNSSVDPGVESLQYADDDGARYYELFDSMADETRLLTTLDGDSQKVFPDVVPHTEAPTRANLREAVSEMREQIRADEKEGVDSELYLVFSGHGNVDDDGKGYLSLRDGKLERNELFRDVVDELGADYTHLIIDACHAYFMVESRGAPDDWQDDRSGESLDGEVDAYLNKREEVPVERSSNVGVIVSTSGTAEVHEWSRFRSGVFSHQLRSALLGAADADDDRAVGYDEIEAYLVAANAGVSNPKARINVFVDPPEQDRSRSLTRLDEFEDATLLEFPRSAGGQYYLEDARGLRYADFNVDQSLETRLVLLHEPVDGEGYFLRAGDQEARIELDEARVESTQLAFADRTDQSRGAIEEAYRAGLFSVPYGDGFYRGFVAARDKGEGASEDDSVDEEGRWRVRPEAGYTLSSHFFGGDGLQHNAAVTGVFRHQRGFGIGPFFGYGLSTGATEVGPGGPIHRFAGGLEASWQIGLTDTTHLTPRLRAGHQAVLFDDDGQAAGDTTGFRSEAGLAFGWDAAGLDMRLEGGFAGNVFTHHAAETLDETWYTSPYLGMSVGF